MVRFLFPSRIKYFVVHSGQKKLNKVQYTQCEHHFLGYRYPITLQQGVHQLGWHQDRRPEKYEWRGGQTMNGFRAPRHVVDSNRSMLRISMVLQPWTFTEYISQEVLHKIQNPSQPALWQKHAWGGDWHPVWHYLEFNFKGCFGGTFSRPKVQVHIVSSSWFSEILHCTIRDEYSPSKNGIS